MMYDVRRTNCFIGLICLISCIGFKEFTAARQHRRTAERMNYGIASEEIKEEYSPRKIGRSSANNGI